MAEGESGAGMRRGVCDACLLALRGAAAVRTPDSEFHFVVVGNNAVVGGGCGMRESTFTRVGEDLLKIHLPYKIQIIKGLYLEMFPVHLLLMTMTMDNNGSDIHLKDNS